MKSFRFAAFCFLLALLGFGLAWYWLGTDKDEGQLPKQTTTPLAAQETAPDRQQTQAKPTATAQTAAPPRSPTNREGRNITAVIIDNQARAIGGADVLYRLTTRQPASECEILAPQEFELEPDTEALQSNPQGEFAIPLPDVADADSYCMLIYAAKPGYAATIVGHPLMDIGERVEIELELLRALHGKVVDPDGRALSAASVKAWWADSQNLNDQACASLAEEGVLQVNTDAAGNFEIQLQGDNSFCLQATHANFASSRPQFVAVTDLDDEGKTSFDLRLRHPSVLSGRVQNQQGDALTNIQLQLTKLALNNGPVPRASSNSAGEFHFSALDFGEYKIEVLSPGFQVASPQKVLLEEDKPLSDVTLRLDPVSEIHGRVLDDRGEPLAGVRVSARSPYLPEQSLSSAISDRSGNFNFSSLHRASAVNDLLKMLATAPTSDAASVPSDDLVCITFYHPRFRGDELSITTHAERLELGDIYLQAANSVLSGQVTNHRGEPLPASLQFHYQAARDAHAGPPQNCAQSEAPLSINTDDQGRFTLHVDNFGDYEVEVETERYSTRRIDVSINANDKNIDIQLR